MLICLRNICCKFYCIFYIIVAICSKSHEVCTSTLTLYHIAYRLFIKTILRKHTYNKRSILDKTYSSMLKFTCRICLRVNIAYLLKLETSLK